jgi:elongation factor G
MIETANAAREALIEMVAEADDGLMEKFFDAGTLSQDDLVAGLKRGVAAARIFPVLLTSATANIGMQPLLDAIVAYAPSPAERPLRARSADGDEVEIATRDGGPASAFVWKTVADPFAGRITLFRVLSGTLKADSTLHNAGRDTPERLGHLILLQGKSQTNVPEIKAGDIGAVAKLKETQTSDVLADKGSTIAVPAITFPEAVISYAIEPKSRGDEEKISTALPPAAGGGPDDQLHARRADQGAAARRPGTVAHRGHRRQAQTPLRRRGDAQAAAHPLPRDDQGDGRGARPPQEADRRPRPVRRLQGEVRAAAERQRLRVRQRHLRRLDPAPVRPGDREGHPGLADARLPGRLPDGRLPRQRLRRLVPPGRLQRNVVQDGGSLAFKDGMARARPTLLEPIMNVEVYAPNDFAGDLMGDLNSRRGRIGGMDTRGASTVIRAKVPMQEMLTYEQHLTSATGGAARTTWSSITTRKSGAPAREIIAASNQERGAEEEEEV